MLGIFGGALSPLTKNVVLTALVLTASLGADILPEESILYTEGEVARADRESVINCIRAFNVGLTDGVSDDHREHRLAVDGFLLMLRGYVAKN